MFELGSIFYYDKNYIKAVEYCDNNGYTIREIEADENGRRFKIVEDKPSAKELAQYEITTIKIWFTSYYAEHEQKHRRLHTLGLKTDEGKDPFIALTELYKEAEAKRKRIQELEALINE